MAIAVSLLTSGDLSLSAAVTASVTYTANALIMVCIGMRDTIPTADQLTVAGLGLTWVRGKENVLSNRIGAIFYSMGAGASGTIAISTLGGTSPIAYSWAVVQVTGVVTTGSNGAGAVNNASPLDNNSQTMNGPQPSVTISGTPATGDVTFASCVTEDGETGITPEAGWTSIVHVAGGETDISVMYNTGQDQTATWTGVRTDGREALTVGILLKAATVVTFPTTSVLDNFNRTENPLSQSGVWTVPLFPGDGDLATNSATAQAAGAGFSSGYRNNANYGSNCEVYCTVSTVPVTGDGVYVASRINLGTGDGYLLIVIKRAGADDWLLKRVDAAVETTLGATMTQEVSNGDSFGLECIGDQISAYYRSGAGSWVLVGTRTDATYSAAGKIALGIEGTTARIDNFGGGTIGGQTTHNTIARPLGMAAGLSRRLFKGWKN